MRIIVISLMILILVSLSFSLVEGHEKGGNKVNQLSEFVPIEIPSTYESNATNGEEIIKEVTMETQEGLTFEGKVRMVFPLEEDLEAPKLISFELSRNLLEAAALTPSFWVNSGDQEGTMSALGGCLKSCNELEGKWEKRWCKVGCWLGLVANVASAIGSFY